MPNKPIFSKWCLVCTLFFMILLLPACGRAESEEALDTTEEVLQEEEALLESDATLVYDALILGDTNGQEMENLALLEEVRISADSEESEEYSAEKAIDGNSADTMSRWSSSNEAGNPDHWICLSFSDQTEVSFLLLTWERLNVESFVIEVSDDAKDWSVCYEQNEAPETNEQAIVLDEGIECWYLRLRTTRVSESEENDFVYYQNVSLLEMEVYAGVPITYGLSLSEIESDEEGNRFLPLPIVPEGYEIAFAGADYEEVIGEDGTVYPTLEEKEVEVGFVITDLADGISVETPAYTVTVPASQKEILRAVGAASFTMEEKEEPALFTAPAEWMGLAGELSFSGTLSVELLQADRELFEDTLLSALSRIEEACGMPWILQDENGDLIASSDHANAAEADLFVSVSAASEDLGLKEEGYLLGITNEKVVLLAQETNGLIWGLQTLSELLEDGISEGNTLSCGIIRDYPRYSVRGFSIDIGRRFVSLDTLKSMIDTLSRYKMNTLGVHLNDNEILSSSGLTDSVESALGAYSGFRLESSVVNDAGESLTSLDGSITKEEWKELVSYGKERGVEVVPEIDMPSHCLAITSLFPQTGLTYNAEIADELDLSSEEAIEIAVEIWGEYVTGLDPTFANNETIHIGMDEYYGNVEEFRSFMTMLIELMQDTGHTVRMWGSLGKMEGEVVVPSENIQVQIWSWLWADPKETYEAGYTIINSMSNTLYIVPGGGYDYLDLEALADWEPNRFVSDNEAVVIPAFSSRMAGAIYCMWNDNFDLGLTEEDLYERFAQPLLLIAGKLW